MRIAIAGGTGRIGRLTSAVLDSAGHQTVPFGRAAGVDAYAGRGLDDALRGADALIDVTNTPAGGRAEIVDFFAAVTSNLLAAEERAGVRHHVLLSVVGIDRNKGVPHYAGKREQERLVASGPVPWSIVRATQFHDYPAMVAGRAEKDGTATVAPLLLQPIAPADVAAELAEVATGAPLGARIDIAGPETQDLVDMARRTFAVRGQDIKLIPTWRGAYGTDLAGEAMLPGKDAKLAPTTFDAWLAAGAK